MYDGIELLSLNGTTQLRISDDAPLTSFTLTVKGIYTYLGDNYVGTVIQRYRVLSLFTEEFLRISIKEIGGLHNYSFNIA